MQGVITPFSLCNVIYFKFESGIWHTLLIYLYMYVTYLSLHVEIATPNQYIVCVKKVVAVSHPPTHPPTHTECRHFYEKTTIAVYYFLY